MARVAGGELERGTGLVMARALAGVEMDVVDVKATGLLVHGDCVNMAQPGKDGAEDQQQSQDHRSGASHTVDYIDRVQHRQAAMVPVKRMRTRKHTLRPHISRLI